MIKGMRHLLFFCFLCAALAASSGVCLSTGVVTFQIEVTAGFTISSPDHLIFEPVAPGQTTYRELIITVWSNVDWELMVATIGEDMPGGLRGQIEFNRSDGVWAPLGKLAYPVRSNQPLTGPTGSEVTIPFRFTGSFEDTPGNYSFQVELTVVPAL